MWRALLAGLIVAAAVVLLLCFIGVKQVGGALPGGRVGFVVGGGLPEARLASVYAISATSPVRVPVALTNPTAEEVVYAVDAGVAGLHQLQGSLYRDGRLVKEGRVKYDLPPFQMHQVRRLPPKATAVVHFELPYIKVAQGLYELRLVYQIHPKSVDETKHGLTVMKLEQTILLDVRAE